MKALIYTEKGKMALEDRPKPEIITPTDAIVRVAKTTICGSDLHIIKGDVPTCAPGGFWGMKALALLIRSGLLSHPLRRAILC